MAAPTIQRPKGRYRLPALGLALVAVVACTSWWVTHPSAFAPHGSVIGAPVEVGETLQVDSGLYPDETVTLQDVRPILAPSSAEAHYSLQVCDRGESGGTGAERAARMCGRFPPVTARGIRPHIRRGEGGGRVCPRLGCPARVGGMPEPELRMLEPGVYAWVHPAPGIGRANAGAVIDADGVTVIDTLMVPSQSAPFGDAVDALGHPVRRVLLTSGHVEFAGGTGRFRLSAVYGTPLTSSQLDRPPNIDGYKRFMPDFAAEFDELQTRPVSHLVDGRTWLTPAIELIPVSGYTPQNLLVLVPAAGVLFAGGMCSFGVTPLCFQADLAAWADALDPVAELDATIVPGHGPVGGQAELRDLQRYLRACVDADGDPSRIPAGPWDGWTDRGLDTINVERAAMLARGEDAVPPTMLQAIGLA